MTEPVERRPNVADLTKGLAISLAALAVPVVVTRLTAGSFAAFSHPFRWWFYAVMLALVAVPWIAARYFSDVNWGRSLAPPVSFFWLLFVSANTRDGGAYTLAGLCLGAWYMWTVKERKTELIQERVRILEAQRDRWVESQSTKRSM